MSNRDTQFTGWASAVLSKMFEATKEHTHGDSLDLGSEEAQQAMLQVVARAGYDLVAHTLHWLENDPYYRRSGVATVKDIPDLAELPEEQAE